MGTYSFTPWDWAVVVLYLIGVTYLGIRMGGRQSSARDFFFSEAKLPWWSVSLAVVATETSSLTFLSIPGLAYAGNWNFLTLALGYVVGRGIVATFFLPRYYEGELTTAYALMEKRFGLVTRRTASAVFMFTRLLADGVRLFATAIPIALILKGDGSGSFLSGLSDPMIYALSILLAGAVTVAYVHVGGIRAVIWTDIMQFFLYLGGALGAIAILLGRIPDFSGAWTSLVDSGKTQVLDLKFSDPLGSPYRFWSAFLGGAFLSMASHGTDQIIVQRLFTAGSLPAARRALWGSGFIVLFQFALFLFLGSLLYIFYAGAKMNRDEVFARFIIGEMPPGLSGLIVAAVLAAAMSTLSGSVSALASASVYDFYVATARGRATDEGTRLRLSRWASALWGVALVCSAFVFIGTRHTVVELTLSLASFTYGGLLGVFFVGLFLSGTGSRAALIGFAAGLAVMLALVLTGAIPWTLYTIVGSGATVLVSVIVARLTTERR